MTKKIKYLWLAFIVFFSLVGLTACDASNNAELQQRIEAAEVENERLQNEVNRLKREFEDIKQEKERLESEVARLEEELEYSKNKEDFVLTISVSSATLQLGEDIEVEMVLKNRSGWRHTILGSVIMTPVVIGSDIYRGDIPGAFNLNILEVDETRIRTSRVGCMLTVGEYVVRAKAEFTILQFNSVGIVESAQDIRLESSAILITVIDGEAPQPEENLGTFYSLKKAYDEGLLKVAELQSIADYVNNNSLPEDVLSAEKSKTIKETWLKEMHDYGRECEIGVYLVATIDDITIHNYYGTYNNAVAIIYTDIYHGSGAVSPGGDTIGGVYFDNYEPAEISIWIANGNSKDQGIL